MKRLLIILAMLLLTGCYTNISNVKTTSTFDQYGSLTGSVTVVDSTVIEGRWDDLYQLLMP